MRCCEDPDSQVQPLAIWADSDYDDSIRTPCYSSSHGTLQTVGTLVSLAQRIASCRPILSRSLEDNFPKLSPSWQKPLTARFPWQGVLNKKLCQAGKNRKVGHYQTTFIFTEADGARRDWSSKESTDLWRLGTHNLEPSSLKPFELQNFQ